MKIHIAALLAVLISACGGGGDAASTTPVRVNLNGDFAPVVVSVVPAAPVAGGPVTLQLATSYDGIQGAGAGTFVVPVTIDRNGGAAYAAGVVTFTRQSGSAKVGVWAGAGSVVLPAQSAGVYSFTATLRPADDYDFLGAVLPGVSLVVTVAP